MHCLSWLEPFFLNEYCQNQQQRKNPYLLTRTFFLISQFDPYRVEKFGKSNCYVSRGKSRIPSHNTKAKKYPTSRSSTHPEGKWGNFLNGHQVLSVAISAGLSLSFASAFRANSPIPHAAAKIPSNGFNQFNSAHGA